MRTGAQRASLTVDEQAQGRGRELRQAAQLDDHGKVRLREQGSQALGIELAR